jgi:hypothetical protein
VLFIVAIAGVPDTQGLLAAAVADPVNCEVPFATIASVPVIVGGVFTVIVPVAFTLPQPPVNGIL